MGSITLPRAVLEQYGTDFFVETGSFTGGAIETAIEAGFSDIRSVEIDPSMYATCVEKFRHDLRVTLYFGDSLALLSEMIADISDPITFWLDAHAGNSNTSGRVPYPLLEELEIIAEHPVKNHVIMIDDVRLFGKGGWKDVTRFKVLDKLLAINRDYEITFVDSNGFQSDILIAHLLEDEDD